MANDILNAVTSVNSDMHRVVSKKINRNVLGYECLFD